MAIEEMTTRASLELEEKIRRRSARIGVIGLGYVGLPLALTFAEAGFEVLGFDLDPEKVEDVNDGRCYIKHLRGDRLVEARRSGRLSASADLARLAEPDALLICVPTPLTPQREPDLRYVLGTGRAIAGALRKGQLVVLESTTYPGTTDGELRTLLEGSGLACGRDFFLAFSPEREDPGNKQFHTKIIPKVVGGTTPACRELACALYGAVLDRVIPVSTTRVAEATKVLENIYRSVNIALVNELKMVFDRMGIDVWEVIDAARTKPFGYQAFTPGPGLGGHCIPIDPFYLTWKAREYGVATRFIELAGEVNSAMPMYVVTKIADALNGHKKALNGSRILVLGVSYKKDVDDIRESPALEIMKLLMAKGASVSYADPYFPRIPPMRHYDFTMDATPLTPEAIAAHDAVLVATDHSEFPYEEIHRAAKLIVDSRNAFHSRGLSGPKVVGA
jgi:UDP-N-acetyl-D-glucosamine dehydrogenase